MCRYSAFFATLLLVVRPPSFGLGRGPFTPPGSAMVRMDRKDLNSNKTNKTKTNYVRPEEVLSIQKFYGIVLCGRVFGGGWDRPDCSVQRLGRPAEVTVQ